MSKHTPGPWTVLPGITSGDIITPMGRVASCVVLTTDAHLIAAAPDMLEALEAAVACGMVPVSSAEEGGAAKFSEQVRVADTIRNAIKKARGTP